jgi:hypothetical protein
MACRRKVFQEHALGQNLAQVEDGQQIVHIRVDALGHSRILDFDRHFVPIQSDRFVHLNIIGKWES